MMKTKGVVWWELRLERCADHSVLSQLCKHDAQCLCCFCPLTLGSLHWQSYPQLPLPSVGRGRGGGHLSSSTAPVLFSAPLCEAVTPFSCTSPWVTFTLQLLSQRICCSSPVLLSLYFCLPLSSLSLSLSDCFLRDSLPVGGSLIIESRVDVPFICPYRLTFLICMSAVNTCGILSFMQSGI